MTHNLNGSETCAIDGCKNNYTPDRTHDGRIVCVTHGENKESDVVQKIFSNISFTPGYGQTGRKVEIMNWECGYCGYDRAYHVTHENPEFGREYETTCANPVCVDHDIPAGVR